MTEIEIWRAAYLMLRWYGETAQQESARRADEFAAAGDPDGAAGWRRVIDAIDQLASRTRPGRCTKRPLPPPRGYCARRHLAARKRPACGSLAACTQLCLC